MRASNLETGDSIRARRETISLSSSSRLPVNSSVMLVKPVRLSLGRAKLSTNPFATGSPRPVPTMGIVLVAFLAAWASLMPPLMMTSGLRLSSSAASAGRRSILFLKRSSIDMIWPRYSRSFAAPCSISQSSVTDHEILPTRNLFGGFYLYAAPGQCRATTTTASTMIRRIERMVFIPTVT